jgi:hypothetical protein
VDSTPIANAGRVALRLRGIALNLALLSLWLWAAGAITFSPYATQGARTTLALVFALAPLLVWLWLRRRRRPSGKLVRWMVALCSLVLLAWCWLLRPSNERAWSTDQQRLPYAEVAGDRVIVHGVRNFVYRSTTDVDPAWEDRSYDLSRLRSVWFVEEPFSNFAGAAHTFLSFGFADGDYLAVSVEIRKEVGESFSPWKGLYRNYEIMYVFGDERDLVQLRTEQRKDTVYLYPVKTTPPLLRAMFVDILARANALATQPEFYNSLTNTCTTNIAAHVNRIDPGLVPFSWHLLLPGYADERALQLGLLDFEGTIEAARERFRINERARGAAGSTDFSARIRER